mmetsp:Transcript_59065/g.165032  ORF Transcript_59065/g.165032 Transcript_59065/m.165032 type:complete len:216 (+) Transcript_59065:85-732(+)
MRKSGPPQLPSHLKPSCKGWSPQAKALNSRATRSMSFPNVRNCKENETPSSQSLRIAESHDGKRNQVCRFARPATEAPRDVRKASGMRAASSNGSSKAATFGGAEPFASQKPARSASRFRFAALERLRATSLVPESSGYAKVAQSLYVRSCSLESRSSGGGSRPKSPPAQRHEPSGARVPQQASAMHSLSNARALLPDAESDSTMVLLTSNASTR